LTGYRDALERVAELMLAGARPCRPLDGGLLQSEMEATGKAPRRCRIQQSFETRSEESL
jgi:hypothetical protein